MSSGGTETEYVASPEQRQILGAMMPMIQNMGQRGAMSSMFPDMGAPLAPTMPSMQGVLTGMNPYDIPNAPAPRQGWFSGLDESVKQGLWEPVNEASNILTERLGGKGQLGSARGGMSGAAGAAIGELYGKASPQIGMQAWGMMQPGMQEQWRAQLGQNQQMFGLGLQERQTDFRNEMNRLLQDYGTSQQAWQMPFSLLGMTPQMTPTNVVTQQPGFGLMDAATLGLMGGSALFGSGAGLIPGIMGLFK